MSIEKIINEAWENKDQVNQNSDKSLKDAVNQIINDLEFKISDANNVIIMDADLSDRCINYYTSSILSNKELLKTDVQIIVNTFTPYQEYKIKYMKLSLIHI